MIARRWLKRQVSNRKARLREEVSATDGHECAVCGSETLLVLKEHPKLGNFLLCDLCDMMHGLGSPKGMDDLGDWAEYKRAILKLHEMWGQSYIDPEEIESC